MKFLRKIGLVTLKELTEVKQNYMELLINKDKKAEKEKALYNKRLGEQHQEFELYKKTMEKDKKDLIDEIKHLKETNNQLSESFEKELRRFQSSKGGFKSSNNKLKKEVKELSEKLKESMSDKYLIKKLPPQKVPKAQEMKIKSTSYQSRIVKNMNRD